MTYKIHYVFGRRAEQDLPGYSSGPCSPLVFTVQRDTPPSSWGSAYGLLGFYRLDFYNACLAAETSSWLCVVPGCDRWIPTYYLDRPTIEVVDNNGGRRELLPGGEQPNPWLSHQEVTAA